MKRRHILKAGAALGAVSALGLAPWRSGQARSHHYDVVVVGAGVAGLAAMETLKKQGVSAILLEASDRRGGRVMTDHSIFGVPYDMGAHWFHGRNNNPLYDYAKKKGFNTYKAPDDEILYVGGREAKSSEYKEFEKWMERAEGAMSKAGRRGKDVSPASVVPDAGDWKNTVNFMTGPFEMAQNMTDFSCKDWWGSQDGRDGYCSEGLGTVVMHRTRKITVELNTPVWQIDWGNNGIVAHTARGAIKARNCIITVSTGVLANSRIKFNPALPADKEESFHQISMGHYNHLALQFDKNFFGIGDDGYLTYKIPSNRSHPTPAMAMLVNLHGSNLSLADVGGEFARELEGEGVEGGIDFALGELRKIFGNKANRNLIKGHATQWSSNPFFDGAYAAAKPGSFKYRKILRQSVDRQIYFAGEACHKRQWATVHGAYNSGIEVAKRVGKRLA